MENNKNLPYYSKTAELSDLPKLMELEKEWPENARASYEELKFRIEKFPQGFFIAVEGTEYIASIICHPYHYHPDDLSHYPDWRTAVDKSYATPPDEGNALYIIAGTCKPGPHAGRVFDFGIIHVVDLAKRMGKQYVVGGAVLPVYARYKEKHGEISAADYAFKQSNNKCIDPLLEKYRRHDFRVPDRNHVIENYYAHEGSCHYSALVVHHLGS